MALPETTQPQKAPARQGNPMQLSVTIRDREGVLFEGTADSVTSYNAKGEFDVLALHANFISIITDRVIVRSGKSAPKVIQLQTGILKVSENIVEVYVGILR